MAIPKTPRKGASKAKAADDASSVDALPDAAANPMPENLPDPLLDAPPPEREVKTDSEDGAAVILGDPTAPAASETADAPTESTLDTPPVEEAAIDKTSVDQTSVIDQTSIDQPPFYQTASDDLPQKTPEPAPRVVKSGPGFVPLVLGGVVAAGIGYGLAMFVVPAGWPFPGTSTLQTQLTQQAEDIASLRAASDDLRATATRALEAAQAAQQVTPETGPDVQPEIAALAERLTALENRTAAAPAATDPALIETLKSDIATLQSGLDAQQAQADDLMKAAETARAEAAAEAQTILLQAALTKVEAAMQNGLPFADDLAKLAETGVTIPDILTQNAETGLPTLNAISASFADSARAALQASLRDNMGDTLGERLGSLWKSQTGARSLIPREGNDPDAILSRADAAVAAGDLQTALTEIAALPEPAQAAMSGWVAQVKLRNDAQTATADLAAALSER